MKDSKMTKPVEFTKELAFWLIYSDNRFNHHVRKYEDALNPNLRKTRAQKMASLEYLYALLNTKYPNGLE